MKITKNYLKHLIKEELEGIGKEDARQHKLEVIFSEDNYNNVDKVVSLKWNNQEIQPDKETEQTLIDAYYKIRGG